MRSPSAAALPALLLVVAVAAHIASAAIIQPRPVDNRRDPHDGELFEWEPVDDDPWPGPSFSFAELPGLADPDAAGATSVSDARARAALLMQVLRAIFNNNNNGSGSAAASKPVASNEVVPGRGQRHAGRTAGTAGTARGQQGQDTKRSERSRASATAQ